MKKNYITLITLLISILSFGQTEIFNLAGGGTLPTGWTETNNVSNQPIDKGSYYLVESGNPSDVIETVTYDLSSYASAEITLDVASYGAGSIYNSALIEVSYDNGVTYTQTEVSSVTTGSSYIDGGTFTLTSVTNEVKIKISNNGESGRGVRLRNLVLTAYSATPTILVNTNSINGFDYEVENGPSDEESFEVVGSFLEDSIIVTAPTNYEVSLTSGGVFGNSVTLNESSGDVSATVYVRLIAGLSINNYVGDILLESLNAVDKTVSLEGNVSPPQTKALVISGVYDAQPSSQPKGVELYALVDISDLSVFGIGAANNGGGSDGIEFTFPSVSITAGSYIYIAASATGFNAFFGFDADYVDGNIGINGDDAIELFENGQVIDVFGDINGTGSAWDYENGWAYRNVEGPSTVFVVSDWIYSGVDNLDATPNSSSTSPFPTATYYTNVLLVEGNYIQNFSTFPNPVTNGTFEIRTATNSIKNVEIFDMLGKKVYSNQIISGKVDVSNIKTGVYILKVEEEGKLATRKLVIK
ncbi:T9SS type A sorting domain-containing protein [Urechidicola croceus]|uniref:Secretion system C-terminal sorting domain-containing protein n=1 Tax=Urechidicola croceus TaxID=1850246 RepID=A0A1D8P9C3_9FLAO|nr:T9SS type A sorting domain-containing protein [Urechidicola croceus]AOW21182.1 hypothetical protein LPB138_11045 [Urechidicola croceus]